MDKEIASLKRSVGRPSKAQPFKAFVVDVLLKQPNLRSLEIVERARQAGDEGGKSALYSLIASVRPRRNRPLSDHDRVPGEIARHGFGQVDVRFKDGAERTLTFFVSRLEYSRFVVASMVQDQSVETCVRMLAAHHAAMGGVPLMAAFDRARPIGLRADGESQVKAVLELIDDIEASGIEPCDAAATYWRAVGNRLAARQPLPAYTLERHAAHLAREALR